MLLVSKNMRGICRKGIPTFWRNSCVFTNWLLMGLLFLSSCQQTTCDQDAQWILDQFYEELAERPYYKELLNDANTLLIEENMVNPLYSTELIVRMKGPMPIPICSTTGHEKRFTSCRSISSMKIKPELFGKSNILEFTPLYFDPGTSTFYLGVTHYCGQDCGVLTLFGIKKQNQNIGIEEIEVGVM